MRKRILAIAMLASVLMLSACGETEKVIEKKLAADKQEASVSHKEKGYMFECSNVKISVDMEAKPYIDKLGEPVSYFEAKSCAFEDMDKIYTYNGYEISTYTTGGVDYVLSVVLLDDTVKTPEGVAIGNDIAKIKEVYGNPTTEADNLLTYEKEEMSLRFILKDGKINSIEYMSNVM